METIRIAIADDHKLFRKGVILSLRPYTQLEFVLEAENGQELLDKLGNSGAQVVLMDLRMPGMDGIETTKAIAQRFPDIKVLILTMYEDERFVYHLMENGANGYLLKNAEPQEIRKAIQDVMSRGYYLNQFVNRILMKKSHARVKATPDLKSEIVLTDRERDVLRNICMEYTATEIATRMGISPRTVEAIRDRLKVKTGSKTTAGLIMYAVKHKIIDDL